MLHLKVSKRVVFNDLGFVDANGEVVITGSERDLEEKVTFEGNEYIAIDWNVLPHSNRSVLVTFLSCCL